MSKNAQLIPSPAGIGELLIMAKQGDTETLTQLSDLYCDGAGVPQDYAEGIRLNRRDSISLVENHIKR